MQGADSRRKPAIPAEFVVVMGVSGTGKMEIAQGLAGALGCTWIEADQVHSAADVERMRSGQGLTDEMHWPWLSSVCTMALESRERPVVIACSALKRSYRDFIRARLLAVRFIFLDGVAAIIAARLSARKGHFASAKPLENQLETFEPPEPDERALRLSIGLSPQAIIEIAMRRIGDGQG